MMFKALLVDDERLARQDMRDLLLQHDNIKVVGEANNLAEAADLINTQQPDVVFLDIQLRHENGFDLLTRVTHQFRLIFVTAFDEFAIRAFEINALDYLLKPVNPSRLKAAIERLNDTSLSHLHHTLTANEANIQHLKMDDRLFLNVGEHSQFVRINDISHICASGDYTELFTIEGIKILVEKPLKEWENRLPEQHFVRIHRCTIINIAEIDTVESLLNRTMKVTLHSVSGSFSVSRRYTTKLRRKYQ